MVPVTWQEKYFCQLLENFTLQFSQLFCQLLFTQQQSWSKVSNLFIGYLELSMAVFVLLQKLIDQLPVRKSSQNFSQGALYLWQGSQTVIIYIYESICLWSTNTLLQKSLITNSPPLEKFPMQVTLTLC